ncbi:hypothetical protein JVU11DRAFT_1411 [Chiua virens]|nr:hypothetical protein JVU11DRAFT_1411 [Chiua virens]
MRVLRRPIAGASQGTGVNWAVTWAESRKRAAAYGIVERTDMCGWQAARDDASLTPSLIPVPSHTRPLCPLCTYPSLSVNLSTRQRHSFHPLSSFSHSGSPESSRYLPQYPLRNWHSGERELENHPLVGRLLSSRRSVRVIISSTAILLARNTSSRSLPLLRTHDLSSPSIPIAPEVTLDRAPTMLVLHEPSAYFLTEQEE